MNTLYFISRSEFSEYWNLFSQYVSISSIFLWGFLGGLLGFVLILIAQIVWRKKILVRRKYKLLKYFTYLYFVFFPLFAGFCFTQWFAFHSIENQIVKNIPTILGESNTLFNAHLKGYLEDLVGKENLNITANQGVEAGMDVAGQAIKVIGLSSDSASLTDAGVALIASKVVQSDMAKNKAKSSIAESIGEKLPIGADLAAELMDTEVSSILETGAINLIVEKKINGIFGGLKLQAFLIFLIGMAIPIAEIVLAHYLERKRLATLSLKQEVLSNDQF